MASDTSLQQQLEASILLDELLHLVTLAGLSVHDTYRGNAQNQAAVHCLREWARIAKPLREPSDHYLAITAEARRFLEQCAKSAE